MFDLIESWRGCETVIIGLCWQEDVEGPSSLGPEICLREIIVLIFYNIKTKL